MMTNSKDEMRRVGSNPFIVIKSLFSLQNNVPSALALNHYLTCETMSQVFLS